MANAENGPYGRHVVITGASSGIGLAIAQRLLSDGWRVTGISRSEPPLKNALFKHLAIDLTDIASIPAALSGLKPTALVHAAGLLRVGGLGSLDPKDGEAMWRLHVAVAELLANSLVPEMADGGRIVLIGSRTSSGAAGRSQYAATKAALVALARSWAARTGTARHNRERRRAGCDETPMLLDPKRKGVAPRLPPIGRFVQPSEVAGATAYLLSHEAGAITAAADYLRRKLTVADACGTSMIPRNALSEVSASARKGPSGQSTSRCALIASAR